MDENHQGDCGQFSLLWKALRAIVNWLLGTPVFIWGADSMCPKDNHKRLNREGTKSFSVCRAERKPPLFRWGHRLFFFVRHFTSGPASVRPLHKKAEYPFLFGAIQKEMVSKKHAPRPQGGLPRRRGAKHTNPTEL